MRVGRAAEYPELDRACRIVSSNEPRYDNGDFKRW